MTVPVDTRVCPYCKEDVKDAATRCPHCRSEIGSDAPGHGGTCPLCREDVKPDALRCKHCGADIGPQADPARAARAGGGCGCGPGGGKGIKGVRHRPRRPSATFSGALWPGGPWECPPTFVDAEGTWAYIYEDDDTCYYWGPH